MSSRPIWGLGVAPAPIGDGFSLERDGATFGMVAYSFLFLALFCRRDNTGRKIGHALLPPITEL